MYQNAKLFNGPKTPIYRDAEHMQSYTTLLRTHFESGSLFSMPSRVEDHSSESPNPHHKRKRRYSHSKKSNRGRRPVLAVGEFGLKETEEGEPTTEGTGVEKGGEGGEIGEEQHVGGPDKEGGDGDAQRTLENGVGESPDTKSKRKKKVLPDVSSQHLTIININLHF